MYGYIYETTNLINGKKYLGKHKSSEFDPEYKGSGTLLWKAIIKYGWSNFKTRMLCPCFSEEELNDEERFIIDYSGAIESDEYYNLAVGGYGGGTPGVPKSSEFSIKMSKIMTGRKLSASTKVKISQNNRKIWKGKHLSEETKRKISESRKALNLDLSGENHPFYGRHHTPETKAVLSEKNRNVSDEVRAKISAAHKGIPLTDEHKSKIGEAHRGVPLTDEHRQNISLGRLGMRFSEDHKSNLSKARVNARYHCTCKFCRKEFLGKSPRSSICNDCRN